VRACRKLGLQVSVFNASTEPEIDGVFVGIIQKGRCPCRRRELIPAQP
jgi:hypothetical protein